jgi:hypothetical protein
MCRQLGPVLGVLLAGVAVVPAVAQGSADPTAITIREPRPDPVLPAALIPFTISSGACRKGHVPVVTMRVFNSLAQAVATLRLRQHGDQVLDTIPLKCGDYVAVWDGTIDGGTRVAPPGVYWLQLSVDDRRSARQVLIRP